MDRTEKIVVGIDVSKDKLDVAVRPGGEAFAVGRDAAGLAALTGRLAKLAPVRIAVEATGGYETVVTAELAAAGLPVVVVNPAQSLSSGLTRGCAPSPRPSAGGRRPTRSTRR
jgi:transposase